jgi:hypothetical protein
MEKLVFEEDEKRGFIPKAPFNMTTPVRIRIKNRFSTSPCVS